MSRYNWSEEIEDALNSQIIVEYRASLHYHVLAAYFYRNDVGLEKLGDYFNKMSLEEREHADKLMKYQTKRGGVVKLETLPVPNITIDKKESVIQSFKLALELEKSVNDQILQLHSIASVNNDPPFTEYLESHFLNEQVDSISFLTKSISLLELINNDGNGLINFVNNL